MSRSLAFWIRCLRGSSGRLERAWRLERGSSERFRNLGRSCAWPQQRSLQSAQPGAPERPWAVAGSLTASCCFPSDGSHGWHGRGGLGRCLSGVPACWEEGACASLPSKLCKALLARAHASIPRRCRRECWELGGKWGLFGVGVAPRTQQRFLRRN